VPGSPSSMISGTDPPRKASTGVPQAMASIMTSPKGSGQSIGNSNPAARPRKLVLALSLISPTNSISAPPRAGQSPAGSKPHPPYQPSPQFSGSPVARAIAMARSGRFSGEMRPTIEPARDFVLGAKQVLVGQTSSHRELSIGRSSAAALRIVSNDFSATRIEADRKRLVPALRSASWSVTSALPAIMSLAGSSPQ
jgi:hypothetical protein